MRLIGNHQGADNKTKDTVMFTGILLSATLLGITLFTNLGASKKLASMCLDIKGKTLAEAGVHITAILILIFILNDRMSLDVNVSITAQDKGNAITAILLLVLLLAGLDMMVLSFIRNDQEYLDIGIAMTCGGIIVYTLSKLYRWYLKDGTEGTDVGSVGSVDTLDNIANLDTTISRP